MSREDRWMSGDYKWISKDDRSRKVINTGCEKCKYAE
jgi:hypothetical protein